MSRFAAPFTALTLALALGAAGCGDAGKEPVDPGNPTPETNEYMPLAVGNTWTFRVTDSDGNVVEKKSEVLRKEPVGGSGPNAEVEAFFVLTTKTDGGPEDKTESWQGNIEFAEGQGQYATVRYREIAYHKATGDKELEEHWNPYKLRGDNFHVAADNGWTEVYTETKLYEDPKEDDEIDGPREDTWAVTADETTVTVQAGTFEKARVFIRRPTGSSSDKVYSFVPGIGKVQETGSQIEQLVDCNVGGKTCAELVKK
jgi:hypothetical protein